jgi:predicted nucleotidyltransferase
MKKQMPNKIYNISELTRIISPVAKSYGVRRLALFGSYARGEAGVNSDVDIRIVDRGSLRGLFRLAGFQRELEESLHVSVDVLPTDSLDEKFLARIRDEEILLYDAQP